MQRKVVTVLFCDVTGSTELGEAVDPEALRALLARYFERMKLILESHGGTVEKFIGDAVMAVFGVPAAHEDDALRACRAAVEMRDAFSELAIQGRIGVNTGEVVTGTNERLVTGDAVNVAARFEQAAAPGEVLIGETTYTLVRDAVAAEPVEALALKGKSDPVAAHRLFSVLDAPERSHATRFVGRDPELARIAATWERTRWEASCELLTIVGEAGVGKSRLVVEALAEVGARVVRGRCLPYGEGITYWPVVEVIKQLATLPSDPLAAAAIRSLLRESEAATSGDEIAWAFRKLLEEQAPLIVVLDDVQWGDETFLDLVESTALLSAGAPLFLLCMARPELVERRPGWSGVLRLEPLPPEHADALIGENVSHELRERIARAAAGNPLFISEMLAMAADNADVDVPPTLKALLAARLDQLDEAERNVLERGSIEGEIFHRGPLQALAPEETQLTTRLAALVRHQLVRPDRAQLAADDGYRFRHLLIRDTAYESLPKTVRADLHTRFADWLEEHGAALVERDEIVGYHLEQAARYKAELAQADPALATRAAERLTSAGRRALWRSDLTAAAGLFERALAQTRPLKVDVVLELDLTDALRDKQAAERIAAALAQRARAANDTLGAALADVRTAQLHAEYASNPDYETVEIVGRSVLPLIEEADDHGRLVHLWSDLAHAANHRMRYEEMAEAGEQAIRNARLAGYQTSSYVWGLGFALVLGPRPADACVDVLDTADPQATNPLTATFRAVLLAMLGRFTEAWSVSRDASDRRFELTGRDWPHRERWNAEIATLAGDHEAAAGDLRRFCGSLEAAGIRGVRATFVSKLGRSLCALGRYDEAEPLAQLGHELADEHDGSSQAGWRQVTARVQASRGAHAEAEILAREAVAIYEPSDAINDQGDTLCDLAEVLAAAGRTDEAADALKQALVRYERKKNLAMIAQVRPRLETLQARIIRT